MLDWDQVEGFDWDAGNARKSGDKHGVSQAEAEQVFFNEPLLVVADVKHSQTEPRFHALGKTEPRFHALGKTEEGRLLHLTFTLRPEQTLIHVISARPLHKKERVIYAQATETDSEI